MATKRPRQAGSGRMAGSPPHTKCPSRKFQQEGNRNQSASANHPLLLAPRCALLVEFCLPLSQPTTAIYLSFLPVLLLSFLPQHHFFSTATVFDSSPLFQTFNTQLRTFDIPPQTNIKMDSFAAPQGRACFTCGQTTHQARDCPNKGAAKCYNCGNEGHMKDLLLLRWHRPHVP
ncbi:hypothetical protein B0H65DRAFT_140955 [Neurospora tetraspora]|uniref:CCHC-type domain-containing protein n=1 Tax=Neurospora tetraspora TaxID=94610 RepID=A0AAE0MUX6_9PEZI|nr:hypothetical protein B0H65DRAFT_140955 [Neurospora tetraspora]